MKLKIWKFWRSTKCHT